jgi:hypothetical protein
MNLKRRLEEQSGRLSKAGFLAAHVEHVMNNSSGRRPYPESFTMDDRTVPYWDVVLIAMTMGEAKWKTIAPFFELPEWSTCQRHKSEKMQMLGMSEIGKHLYDGHPDHMRSVSLTRGISYGA